MDEDTALATLIAYKRRRNNKPYLQMAEAVSYLKKKYSSLEEVASKVGYKRETLRELECLLDLPETAKKLVRSGRLGQDAHKILLVKPRSRREQLAKTIADLNTSDARAVIEYVRKNPNLSIDKCKQRVLESKTVKEKVFMVVVPLSEEEYVKLKDQSVTRKISIDQMARLIVANWLKRRR
jgi:hypothetical protein